MASPFIHANPAYLLGSLEKYADFNLKRGSKIVEAANNGEDSVLLVRLRCSEKSAEENWHVVSR
jgi:hypothetical protein